RNHVFTERLFAARQLNLAGALAAASQVESQSRESLGGKNSCGEYRKTAKPRTRTAREHDARARQRRVRRRRREDPVQSTLRAIEYKRLLGACAAQRGGSFPPIHRASLPSVVRYPPASTRSRFRPARDVELCARLDRAGRESHATRCVCARAGSASETARPWSGRARLGARRAGPPRGRSRRTSCRGRIRARKLCPRA